MVVDRLRIVLSNLLHGVVTGNKSGIMHASLRCHLPENSCILDQLLPQLHHIIFLLDLHWFLLYWIFRFELLLLHIGHSLELVMLFVAEARDLCSVVR